MFTFGDTDKDWVERLHYPLQRAICTIHGHVPERDQCMRPEHDFCLWCHKSMPNSWKPKSE